MFPSIPRVTVALLFAIVIADTASGQAAPARLTLADGPALEGTAYSLSLVQDASLAGGGAHIVREARLRFRVTDGERIDDMRSRVAIVFDSARGAVSSPHGREVVDGRRLVGRPLSLEYSHDGAVTDWTPPVPSLDFGVFGGGLPVSALLDFVFPDVGRPLREGEQWETTVRRRSIDGNALTEESVATRWTLDRIETADGATLAHVTFSMRRPGVRPLAAAGSFVLDARTGILLELSLEETVPGTWDTGAEEMSFEQTTTVHIVAHADPVSGTAYRP